LWDRRLFGSGPEERRRSLPGQVAEDSKRSAVC
jgi:hypothetical protein